MGLFSFLKNLFSKADAIEKQVESFVQEAEVKAPEVIAEVKSTVTKVKKAKADAEAVVAQVEETVATMKAKKPRAKKAATK